MIPPLTKWIAVGAGFAALLSFGLVETFAPGNLAEWLTTFAATLVSAALAVAGGIWLFHYQTSISDEREHTRLQTMLAAELRLNLDALIERPAPILHARTGEKLGQTVAVQLPMKALEDLIHSGHEDRDVSFELMRLAAHMRVHNSDVASLQGSRDNGLTRASIRYTTAEMNRRQQLLKHHFESLLERLREADIEPPPSLAVDAAPVPYSPDDR